MHTIAQLEQHLKDHQDLYTYIELGCDYENCWEWVVYIHTKNCDSFLPHGIGGSLDDAIANALESSRAYLAGELD